METLTRQEKEIVGLVIGTLLGFPLRLAIVTGCLAYVMPFWLAYAQSPKSWVWWYGLLIGLVPIKYIPRLAVLAAIGTFFASFFI